MQHGYFLLDEESKRTEQVFISREKKSCFFSGFWKSQRLCDLWQNSLSKSSITPIHIQALFNSKNWCYCHLPADWHSISSYSSPIGPCACLQVRSRIGSRPLPRGGVGIVVRPVWPSRRTVPSALRSTPVGTRSGGPPAPRSRPLPFIPAAKILEGRGARSEPKWNRMWGAGWVSTRVWSVPLRPARQGQASTAALTTGAVCQDSPTCRDFSGMGLGRPRNQPFAVNWGTGSCQRVP